MSGTRYDDINNNDNVIYFGVYVLNLEKKKNSKHNKENEWRMCFSKLAIQVALIKNKYYKQ